MKEKRGLFLGLAVISFLPYLLYGFQYFPILDDYIQYWAYPAYGDLSYVYQTIGTVKTRPIASFLDPAFWGRFWPYLGVALLLITFLHLFSAFFLQKTLSRCRVRVSPFFFLIYLLLPLGMEGRYWLSAATRLVVGMFFASASLFFCSRFLQEKQSPGYFLLFGLFQLIACGFYESVSVFAASAAVLLFCLCFYQNRKKTAFLVPVASMVNIGFMFTYYKVFAQLGNSGTRAEDLSLATLPDKLLSLVRQLGEVASLIGERVFGGSISGVALLWHKGLWGVAVLLIIVVGVIFLCRYGGKRQKQSGLQILLFEITGLILFVAPLVPNLLANEVWLTNRSLFVSILGLAFMLEPLFAALGGKARNIVLFVMAFVFITASVYEYDVYRQVNRQDAALLDIVIQEMSPETCAGEQEVVVILSKPVATEQRAFYKDHVKSVFDSDWALTGAVRARMQSLQPRRILPVVDGQPYDGDNKQIIELLVP